MRATFRMVLCMVVAMGLTHLRASAQEAKKIQPPAKDELRYDGKTFDYWKEFLRTELKPERQIEGVRAITAFGKNGHAKEAAEFLVSWLRLGRDAGKGVNAKVYDELKVTIWNAFYDIGPTSVPFLLKNADDPKIYEYCEYAYGWPGWGYQPIDLPPSSVPILISMIEGKDKNLRRLAMYIMDEKWSEHLKKELFRFLKTKDRQTRLVTTLVRLQEDEDSWRAYRLLREFGPKAVFAREKVLEGAFRFEEWLQQAKYSALPGKNLHEQFQKLWKSLGGKEIELRSFLVKCVDDKHEKVRYHGIRWVGTMEPNLAATKVIGRLHDKNEEVQLAAIAVLAKCDISPKKLVKPLIAVIDDRKTTKTMLEKTAELLGSYGPEADAAVLSLVKAVRGRVDIIEEKRAHGTQIMWGNEKARAAQEAMIRALGDIHSNADIVVPVLMQFLEPDPYYNYESAAINALAKFGPDAKAALPLLRKAAKSGDESVRHAAEEAIRSIEGKKKSGK